MHVILVATQKGGSGKSTLAAHFGALAQLAGPTPPHRRGPAGLPVVLVQAPRSRDALAGEGRRQHYRRHPGRS